MAYFERFWFNEDSGKCEKFVYGGCGGNGNNFETLEACEDRCVESDESSTSEDGACSQPKAVGPCKARLPRFFYNENSGKCEEFMYGGCQGNRNNFATRDACEDRCVDADQNDGCVCTFIWAPVCGKDGKTYSNDCTAQCKGVEVEREGACEKPAPVRRNACVCPADWAPVCGEDGNTYSNDCSAECENVKVAREGPCDPESEAEPSDANVFRDMFSRIREKANGKMDALRSLVEDGAGSGGFVGKVRDTMTDARAMIDAAYWDLMKKEAEDAVEEAKALPSDWDALRDLVEDGAGSGGFVGMFHDSLPDLRAKIEAAKGNPKGVWEALKKKAENATEEAKDKIEGAMKGNEGVIRDKIKWFLGHRYENENSAENEPSAETDEVAPIDAVTGLKAPSFGCVCTFDWSPVCGKDGNTYSNKCSAQCEGVEVEREGECDSEPEKPCQCTEEWAPVCGEDGKTYSNSCTAQCQGVAVEREGECDGDEKQPGGGPSKREAKKAAKKAKKAAKKKAKMAKRKADAEE